MRVSPARAAAFDSLLKIYRDGAFSSIVLPAAEAGLSEKDRALCHEIVLGVLRTRLMLDAAIDRFAGGKQLDAEVRIAAQIGLYQLQFLEKIPKYSAVNESVGLVHRAKKTSAKGFVNALLRRGQGLLSGFEHPDDLYRLSIETSHPHWLLDRWIGEFGPENAEKIADANNRRPRLAFRITARGREAGIIPREDWQKSEYREGGFFIDRGTAELRSLAANGLVYFQDEASQLVGSLAVPPAGTKLLDVSAAPGSKTTLIAAGAPPDVFIAAGDLYQSRVRILNASCEAQGVVNVNIVRFDAETSLPFPDESFDSVLVDAPCSGTGTIRNNPEIRYFLKENDFGEFHGKQLAILRNASKLVNRGGRIVYSTCSLEREENESVVGEFLSGTDEFEKMRPPVAGELITPEGFLRTSPAEHEMDGFFAAVLQRRK